VRFMMCFSFVVRWWPRRRPDGEGKPGSVPRAARPAR